MKRYVSIDFLRGLAIFMMIYLHTLMRWLDRNSFLNEMYTNGVPLLLVVILIVTLFLGSWAGFFLMVSAMGNMVSMYKTLEKGRSAKIVIYRQVVGGFLLLFFAFLTEGVIGYKGAIGDLLIGNKEWYKLLYYRGYHFETIHTIAWCIVINGIVQGLLSMNGGYKKINRNIKIYAVLAVIVILLTEPVWQAFNAAVNDNFAYGINPVTGVGWQYGYWGKLPWWLNIALIFIEPWAGQVEPLFPFMAVSFIGSILALLVLKATEESKEGKVPSTRPLTLGMYIGFIMFVAGVIGVIAMAAGASDPFDMILGVLSDGWSLNLIDYNYGLIWIPYFFILTGSQIVAVLLLIRLVEFRGKAAEFARKTLIIRRFGFVAFSVYNYQYLDVIPVYLFTLLPGWPDYKPYTFNIVQIWFPLLAIIGLWILVLWAWEKAGYAFGLEWFIAKLSYILIPAKREAADSKLPWWKIRRLDPETALHNAEWINIIPSDKIDHSAAVESRLAFKLAFWGLLFPPLFFLTYNIAGNAKKTEGVNKYNKIAETFSLVGIILTLIVIVLLCVLNSSILF